MIHLQDVKKVALLMATAATNATASARVDTLGFNYCTFLATLPKATATNSSAKWGVLKITEGDTTAVSSASAIVKLTGTTNTVTDATNGFVIAANNNTSDPQITELGVPCGGARKRYLFVTYQAADSHSTVNLTAHLSRAMEAPNTDTERGVAVSSYLGAA